MYNVFSLGIIVHLIREKIINTKIGLLYLFFLFAGILLLSSRAGIGSAFIFILFTVFVYLRTKKRFFLKFCLITFGLILFGLSLISTTRLDKTLYLKEHAETKETRLEMWDANLKLSAERIIFGFGIGDVDSVRNEKYNEVKMFEAAKHNLNAHNQYLESLLNGGLVLFLSLISLLLIPFIQSSIDKNYLLTFFIVIIGFNFLFESMLERFQGVFFLFYFYPLILFIIENKKPYN